MSKRWKELVSVIESWPSERQEHAAAVLAVLVEQGAETYKLSDESASASRCRGPRPGAASLRRTRRSPRFFASTAYETPLYAELAGRSG